MFMVYNTPGDLNSVQACTVSQQLCLQAPSLLDNRKGEDVELVLQSSATNNKSEFTLALNMFLISDTSGNFTSNRVHPIPLATSMARNATPQRSHVSHAIRSPIAMSCASLSLCR